MSLTATAPLTPAEERRLIADARAGSADAVARLVTSQLPALRATARTYGAASGLDRDDLVSAGVEALLGAISSFDVSRGTRLFTHAQASVREAMADEVAAYSAAIAVPGRTLRRYRRAIRETTSLVAARELAHTRDGMDPVTFDSVHAAMTGGISLDERTAGQGGPDQTAGDVSLAERLPAAEGGTTPEATAEARALSRQALAVCATDQERLVITRAFGLDGGEPLDDGRIALLVGSHRTTVLRTRTAVLARMRAALAA